ncbi:methyltransferase domain-containing protein [Candidatus Gottesmanbacteria bacterium]|nr:methyltransferase domain-containing protein [Candidatus Gottesmanbacteria bacterium]
MNEFGPKYFGTRNYFSGYDNYGGIGLWKSTVDAINRYVYNQNKEARVLDVGCAFGYLLKHLKPNQHKFGLDISEYALSKAQQNTPSANLVQAEALHLPYMSEAFDCVTALDVCEHIPDFAGSVKELARITKQDGIVIIGTPITDTFEGKVWGKYLDTDPTHVSKPSYKQLYSALDQAGLKILEQWYYFPLPWKELRFPRTNIKVVTRKI